MNAATCSTLGIGRRPEPPIGLVAGWGSYPRAVAESLVSRGHRIACVGLTDHADPKLAELCESFTWCGFTKIGRAVRILRRARCEVAVMAGKVLKTKLFESWRWIKLAPDWRTWQIMFRLARKDWRDDTLLMSVVEEFARDGIKIMPATDFAPDLLVKAGQLTRRGPTAAERADIEFGWTMAKEMGRLDIGQSVAVKNRAVLAVEAIEGTDACIQRAGRLCPMGGFTVVKVAKPRQDMRFDVPTIGIGTLATLHTAGGRVLLIEADRTIILDRAEVIAFADLHKLVLVALDARALATPLSAA